MGWGRERQREQRDRRSQFIVPQPQSWRNPRPAPHLPDIQRHLRPPRLPAWVHVWWPALLWAGVIFSASTDTFSAEHTRWVCEPILRWLDPSLTEDQISTIHRFIRKRSEEHTSELQSPCNLVCRLLLEKKNILRTCVRTRQNDSARANAGRVE